jgi:putative ABC transport system permease protein
MQFSTLQIAWRNLGRNRRRTLLALGAIALGQLTLVAVNGMMAGSFEEILQTITGPLVGHVQVHHKDWREERAIDLCIHDLAKTETEIERIPSVRSISARIYSPVLAASGEKTDKPADAEAAMIVGVDVAAESRDGGILESLPRNKLPHAREVVLGRVLATRLNLRPGQEIAVIGQDADEFPTSDLFVVRAVIRGTVEVINRTGIVMPMTDAAEFLAMPDQAHEIVILGDDHRRAEELAAAIKAIPLLAEAEVLPWRKAAPELATIVDMKSRVDLLFVGILFVAAAAGIANTMMMSTFERTREFGALLAVGCRPTRMVRMVLLESVVLGLVGVAIGSLLGAVIVLITSHTGIDYSALGGVRAEDVAFKGLSIPYIVYPKFEFIHIVYGVAAVTLTSVVASLWPAALVARLQPVEAMRS